MADLLINRDPEELVNFTDAQVLAYLLAMAGVDELDSFDLAHDLLEEYDTLRQVLSLPPDALTSFPGLGEEAGAFLALSRDLLSRYLSNDARYMIQINGRDDLQRLFLPYFHSVNTEQVCLICVDQEHRLLTSGVVAQGGPSTVGLSLRRIMNLALRHRASGVYMAHNHPNGVAIFSINDLDSTRSLSHCLNLMEVALLDHFLIVGNEMVSLSDLVIAKGLPDNPFSTMKPRPDLPG